ncbi:MAG: tRNA (N6-isopentenyl adenosine(37)-C2)-methylthiotransferase MiaB [Puniceicoccales bacterium]|jgi:tRNA-2-methylthio-N6-dimethylallyladenosine synthase|nr:tRNA (N6-isopentenyl adenosine(37)-C2)-methylthiotransferase MiaB [Puniceicoccales bacterium]
MALHRKIAAVGQKTSTVGRPVFLDKTQGPTKIAGRTEAQPPPCQSGRRFQFFSLTGQEISIATPIFYDTSTAVGRRVHIITFGCQMNGRDSEAMAAALENDGHRIVDDEAEADLVVVNTCSVREGAETRALGRLRQLVGQKRRRCGLLVGVAGCMAQRLGAVLFSLVPGLDFVLGTGQLDRIAAVLHRLEAGERQIVCAEPRNFLPKMRRRHGRPSAEVAISTGCPMACTYCIVPQTRGRGACRPMDDVVGEVKLLAEGGTREVVLLGQIVNFYGLRQLPTIGGKSPFVQLLERIHSVAGIERIRFLSPHPCGFREDLLRCFRDLPKLCHAVHLPLQSGSNRILRSMRRGYTKEMALSLLHRLREDYPEMSLSTDLIVGFPGEEDADFRETEQLFSEIDFDMAYIFRYSSRSGTPAAAMENQISHGTAAERQQILLQKLAETSLRRNRLFLNRTLPVLVEQFSPKNPRIAIGHSFHGKKVFFPAHGRLLGKMVSVRVDRAGVGFLGGVEET